MRKVNLPYLPDGFSAEEEGDFLYILYQGKIAETLSSSGSRPEVIIMVAEAYLASISSKQN